MAPNPERCPACKEASATSLTIPEPDGPRCVWHFCACGSLFHPKTPDPAVFQNGYRDQYSQIKDFQAHILHLERVYLPLIEELVYGRRFLDVGFTVPVLMDALRARGWLAKGIDLIKTPGHIHGDFEQYKFQVDGDQRYDFIHMGHVLESFRDPVAALRKAYELLRPNGVLLITTPDAEIMWQTGFKLFGHFNSKQACFFFSERELLRQLNKIGFDLILRHKNLSRRFISWNNLHLLVMKPHLGDDNHGS